LCSIAHWIAGRGQSVAARRTTTKGELSLPGAWRVSLFTVMTLLGALMATAATFLQVIQERDTRRTRDVAAQESTQLRREADVQRAQNARLRQELVLLEQQLAALSASRGGEGQRSDQSEKNKAQDERLAALESQQARINDTILASPDKALELPFMRRDLQEIRSVQAEASASLRREVDRIYDFNKWLFGGISLTLVGLGLQSFLAARSGKTTPPPAKADE